MRNRPRAKRKPYPSTISDEKWSFVAPYLTLCREDAPQREYPLRATTLIWKPVLVVEQHFRKLNAPHLCPDVYEGAVFHDGICTVTPTREWIAA